MVDLFHWDIAPHYWFECVLITRWWMTSSTNGSTAAGSKRHIGAEAPHPQTYNRAHHQRSEKDGKNKCNWRIAAPDQPVVGHNIPVNIVYENLQKEEALRNKPVQYCVTDQKWDTLFVWKAEVVG